MNIREELATRAEQFESMLASYLPKEEGMQKTI